MERDWVLMPTYCRKISQGKDTKKTCLPAGTVTNNYQLPGCLQMLASKQRLEHHFYVEPYQDALIWETQIYYGKFPRTTRSHLND